MGGGHAIVSEGTPNQVTTLAFIKTNFTVDGDFTATLTGDYSGINWSPGHQISNLSGNQEAGAFQANFPSTGVANLFGVGDENGFFLGNNIDNQVQRGIFAGGGHYVQTFRIERSGSTVSVSTMDHVSGLTFPFVVWQTSSAADLAGPVDFEFYFENGNNNLSGGSIDWSEFTVTADRFTGLTPTGVPLPPSALLLGSGLLGLVGWRKLKS